MEKVATRLTKGSAARGPRIFGNSLIFAPPDPEIGMAEEAIGTSSFPLLNVYFPFGMNQEITERRNKKKSCPNH